MLPQGLRGWSVTAGAAFGLVCLVTASRPFLTRALAARLHGATEPAGPFDALEGVDVFDEPGMLAAAGCGSRACFDGHTASADPLYRDLHHLSGFGASFAFGAFAVPDARR